MSVIAEFLAPLSIYPLSEVLTSYPDARVEVDAVVPVGGSTHYVWVHGDHLDPIVGELRTDPTTSSVEVLDELPERALVRFQWSTADSPVIELIETVGGRIVDAVGSSDGWTLRIRFPDQTALRTFFATSQDHALDIQLRQLFDPDSITIDDRFGISPKQRETLEAAFDAGYFDIPRQVTLHELATELGVSEQGVSERLRRGLSTYLEAVLSDGDGEEANQDP